jgi:hypothetical protein
MYKYADDVNVLWNNINAVKRNTEALSDTNKEAGREVNTEEAKYMSMFAVSSQKLRKTVIIKI